MNDENHGDMHPQLMQYLELCKRIYERMERENSWPFKSLDTPEELGEK